MSVAAQPRISGALRAELPFGCVVLAAVGLTLVAADYPQNLPGAGLAAIVLLIARADFRARLIPNSANLAAAALGLVGASMAGQTQLDVLEAIARGASLFLLFLAFKWAFRYWRGHEGMGLGDVKLAGVLGLWLDWPYIPIAIELACLSAIACVLAPRIVSRRPLDRMAKIPFGVFLAPAIWLTWLYVKILN